MEYLKIWVSFAEILEPLNDSERGRLFTAMLEYAATGTLPEFKGNERFTWPAAKQAIDRARAESERLTANGSKGGRPRKNQQKPNETNENQQKPNESHKDNNKDNINNKDKDSDNNAREEWPFGLTDEEVQESLEREAQIEDAAKSAGLNTSEYSMITARRYAHDYGMDKLLDAIQKTALGAQKPSWAYVEGVLKGKGAKTNDNHRGNYQSDSDKPRTTYDLKPTFV